MQNAFARQDAKAPDTPLPATAGAMPSPETVPASLRDAPYAAANPPAELMNKLETLLRQGHIKDCATASAKVLPHFGQSPFMWDLFGRCHLQLNALDEAQTCLHKAAQLAPETGAPLSSLGELWLRRGDLAQAEAYFGAALERAPRDLNALSGKVRVLSRLGRMQEARKCCEQAVALHPAHAALQFNFGNVLRGCGDTNAATQAYARALELAPDLQPARYNLAQMLATTGREQEALPYFETLLEQTPDDDRALAHKLHIQAQLNDWQCFDDYARVRRTLGLRGTAVPPFLLMGMEDNPDLQRVRSRAYGAEKIPAPAAPVTSPTTAPARPASRPDRLRIGYFSADFHNHATMRLMGGLFEQHDRSRFHISAFSFGPDRNDAQRQRLVANVDQFHACETLSDEGLTALAQAENLDIAVDLKGYTGQARSGIFARRLAPLQLSYLGYPGTLGSPAFDYILTDPVVSPVGSEHHFEESLLRLPHCYQPNDDKRQIAPRQFTRGACGLPEKGFVFACFNNSYKITPREFDIWMPLLAQIEGSVLWLLSNGTKSEQNLRSEAEARGIDPARLIFAGRMPQDEHLARQKVADLFLDTFAYNAHTTGSDALWAGLPVLTLPGRQFSARVGASLVTAVGLPELIAKDEQHYQDLALHYATDEAALLSLRSRLNPLRSKAPLFDTKGHTAELERGFDMIHARLREGLAPTHLSVPADTKSAPSKPEDHRASGTGQASAVA